MGGLSSRCATPLWSFRTSSGYELIGFRALSDAQTEVLVDILVFYVFETFPRFGEVQVLHLLEGKNIRYEYTLRYDPVTQKLQAITLEDCVLHVRKTVFSRDARVRDVLLSATV